MQGPERKRCPSDDLAQMAARIFAQGRVKSVAQAIDLACHQNAGQIHDRPTQGAVRRHLQGLALSALGASGYAARTLGVLSLAEEIMILFRDDSPMLTGRAARGLFDGEVRLHMRIYTNEQVSAIAKRIESERSVHDLVIDTLNTRYGRLNRIVWDEAGVDIVLVRCLRSMKTDAHLHLLRHERVPSCTLTQLQSRIAELSLALE